MLVNGGPISAMGIRARSVAEHLAGRFEIELVYREGGRAAAAGRFLRALRASRPDVVYVLDVVVPAVAAALAARRLRRAALVVDTGDAVAALAAQVGRGPLGVLLSTALEHAALRSADALVVRSRYHAEWLAGAGLHAAVVPDGVDASAVAAASTAEAAGRLRRRLGLGGVRVVGTLGSSVWNARLGTCYGYELPDVLAATAGRPVKALLVGGGTGIARVVEKARALGVADRLVTVGPVPYDDLPPYLRLMDVAVSTQTDDLVGRVRTTGKLPLYLASGRYVLATSVGEAARVLPAEMLIDYAGSSDPTYPGRLAARVGALMAQPGRLDVAPEMQRIARQRFDYRVLAPRVADVLDRALGRRPAPRTRRAVVAAAHP